MRTSTQKGNITKKNQSQLRNVITEMKITLQGINSRVGEGDDQISDLEGKEVENTHPITTAKRKKNF